MESRYQRTQELEKALNAVRRADQGMLHWGNALQAVYAALDIPLPHDSHFQWNDLDRAANERRRRL